MAKNNNIVEIEKAAEEVANEVLEETNEMQEKAVKKGTSIGHYVGTHWKGWLKNAAIFGLGVAFGAGGYMLFGPSSVEVPGTTATPTPDVTTVYF